MRKRSLSVKNKRFRGWTVGWSLPIYFFFEYAFPLGPSCRSRLRRSCCFVAWIVTQRVLSTAAVWLGLCRYLITRQNHPPGFIIGIRNDFIQHAWKNGWHTNYERVLDGRITPSILHWFEILREKNNSSLIANSQLYALIFQSNLIFSLY